MSVIDKWLNIHRQNAGAATSATSARNPNNACNPNALDVTRRLLQGCYIPPDVAACSSQAATENPIVDQCFKADVADVANVAGGENQKAAGNATIGYSICCECGLPIAERLETWWGGERCHRACGEAAWRRETREIAIAAKET